MPRYFHQVNLSKPQYLWSNRDWRVFRATCAPTKRQLELAASIIPAWRSGTPISELAERGKTSRAYIYEILAMEELRDREKMKKFYAKRKNLGRPLDMGGSRDVWIDDDFPFPTPSQNLTPRS